MCAIAGLINWGDRKSLERMTEAQIHRGPDDGGVWESQLPEGGWAGLGSRRLAILDLSPAGHMPMSNPAQNLWIAYNGEIYNFLELKKELQAKGRIFKSNSDTEVILHLYELYGDACVNYLRGMFAFAIWDQKKNRLFAARDRMGIKPFYYVHQGERLAFASEIKALLASGLIEPALNTRSAAAFLNLGYVPAPESIFQNVLSLLPGHTLVFENRRLKIERYWKPDFKTKKPIAEEKAVEEISAALEDSVRSHLISDVPIGAFLSGGIDSTAAVALMRKHITGELRTFSITFPEAEFSEGPYAKMAAQRFGTCHTEYEVTGTDCLRELDRVIEAMDQPTIDGFNTYFVSKSTRESGTIAAFSGLGGDELFCGYSTFHQVPKLHRGLQALHTLPRPVTSGIAAALRGFGSMRMHKLASLVGSGSAGFPEIYFNYRAFFTGKPLEDLIQPAAWRSLESSWGPVYWDPELFSETGLHPLDKVSELEMSAYMANQLLRDTDAMSMRHSLEVRVPFLDHRVVELVAGLNGSIKMSQDIPKRLLVKALGSALPSEIVQRKKQGFAFPFERWMRRELRPVIEGALDRMPDGGFLDRKEARRLWTRFLAGQEQWARVWILAVFQLWSERYKVDIIRTSK